MRQLFTWRFLAVIGALAGLTLLVNAAFTGPAEIAAIVEEKTPDRRIDLIAPVSFVKTSDDFEVGPDGAMTGIIDVVLDDGRVMRATTGAFADLDCAQLNGVNRCAVFADLLGEAVIWFAILDRTPRSTVELPPIIDLEDGYALFENGWQIQYPPVIERQCDEDIVNFSDFLRRFGPRSTSIVDLATQEVTAVRCAGTDVVEPGPTSTVAPIGDVPTEAPADVPTEAPTG